MTERDGLFLQHILAAVADIQEFTAGGRDAFLADRKTQSAVIRQIEIIGEAVKNLSAELTESAPGVPWRLIAGTRDRLIHAYFKVDLDMVWVMVEHDLPDLRDRVQGLTSGRDAPC
jgi:uncharacterized protein with HEPN domain